jgi:threonine aldolase
MEALVRANAGAAKAYGADEHTRRAEELFRREFGDDTGVYFVFNGTGANVVGLSALTTSFGAVLCAETAHIQVDECGAPEKFTSNKLLTVKTPDGKLRPADLEPLLAGRGDVHRAQPTVLSISQSTELGTVYSLAELKALGDFCRQHGLYFHMDGSRIANAALSLGCELRETTRDCGVDVLSFGGTKNGILFGEAVLVFRRELRERVPYLRKQAMQLASKMRYLAVQFEALLEDGLWRENAAHANAMARRLEEHLRPVAAVKILQKVEANALFVSFPREALAKLLERYYFYVLGSETSTDRSTKRSTVRLMNSFETRPNDVDEFGSLVKKLCS